MRNKQMSGRMGGRMGGKTFSGIVRAKERLDTFDKASNLNDRNKHKAIKKWLNRRAKVCKRETHKMWVGLRFETKANLWE